MGQAAEYSWMEMGGEGEARRKRRAGASIFLVEVHQALEVAARDSIWFEMQNRYTGLGPLATAAHEYRVAAVRDAAVHRCAATVWGGWLLGGV